MDVQKDIEARIKAALGELQAQVIFLTAHLEAANRRVKELEEAAKPPA